MTFHLKDDVNFFFVLDNGSINHEKLIQVAATMAAMMSEETEDTDNKVKGQFIRKGQVGGWKDELKPEHAMLIDEMTKRKADTDELATIFAEK
jgi:hypothetical protein